MIDFTKGPWAYRPDEYDDWGIVKDSEMFVICQARDRRYSDDVYLTGCRSNKTDPWMANAHLISAAPDMFEALDGCADMLQDILEGRPWSSVEEQLDEARAALAKARGEPNGSNI